jgi:hypothetical protein
MNKIKEFYIFKDFGSYLGNRECFLKLKIFDKDGIFFTNTIIDNVWHGLKDTEIDREKHRTHIFSSLYSGIIW